MTVPLTVPSVIFGISMNVLDEEGGSVLKQDILKSGASFWGIWGRRNSQRPGQIGHETEA